MLFVHPEVQSSNMSGLFALTKGEHEDSGRGRGLNYL